MDMQNIHALTGSIRERFVKKLARGESVLGPFMKTCDPAFVEAAGLAGMDFAILDIEHGPNNIYTLQNLIRAAQCGGILPVVRVPGIDESVISKALDIGAMGIQAPQITNAEQVARLIKVARFAPLGERGVCRFVRAAGYSTTDRFQYFEQANQVLIIIQLEGLEALANLESIFAAPGIDIVFIGPYDLSQSLGVAGQIEHPLVEEKMREIVNAAKRNNIRIGTFADTVENALKWQAQGVQYISYSVDVGLFAECCAGLVKRLAHQ